MNADIHFVQGGDEAVIAGSDSGMLSCGCGNRLIAGYDKALFLGVGIQCARCGAVTSTPPMAEGAALPLAAIVAEPSVEPRLTTMTVPPRVTVVGRAEMERLAALYRPVTPADNIYQLTRERLDEAAEAYQRHVGAALPDVASEAGEPFRGLRQHALGWAIGHLRAQAGSWRCTQDDPTANAALHVAGFLHFVATWSHHPLFPAMAATAAERGCSLHGLAPFAAAHCLSMMGNRINFPLPVGSPGRIEDFSLVTGAADLVQVHTEVFDRFEYPLGRAWDQASLLTAVSEVIAAAPGRINLRNPGLLLLSPGNALAGFDEALIKAVESAMGTLGRKNRGLIGVALVTLRLQPLPDPMAIRFGYGMFPLLNRHYRGETGLRIGA